MSHQSRKAIWLPILIFASGLSALPGRAAAEDFTSIPNAFGGFNYIGNGRIITSMPNAFGGFNYSETLTGAAAANAQAAPAGPPPKPNARQRAAEAQNAGGRSSSRPSTTAWWNWPTPRAERGTTPRRGS